MPPLAGTLAAARRGPSRRRGRGRARVRDRARHAAAGRLGRGRAGERAGPHDRADRRQRLARVVEPARAGLARDRRLPPGRGAARRDRIRAVHGDPARVALAPHGPRCSWPPCPSDAGSSAARGGCGSATSPCWAWPPASCRRWWPPPARSPRRFSSATASAAAPSWEPRPCAPPACTSPRRSCTAATPW